MSYVKVTQFRECS